MLSLPGLRSMPENVESRKSAPSTPSTTEVTVGSAGTSQNMGSMRSKPAVRKNELSSSVSPGSIGRSVVASISLILSR